MATNYGYITLHDDILKTVSYKIQLEYFDEMQVIQNGVVVETKYINHRTVEINRVGNNYLAFLEKYTDTRSIQLLKKKIQATQRLHGSTDGVRFRFVLT